MSRRVKGEAQVWQGVVSIRRKRGIQGWSIIRLNGTYEIPIKDSYFGIIHKSLK